MVCSTTTEPLLLPSPFSNTSFTKESTFQAAGAGVGYCYLAGVLAAGTAGTAAELLVCHARGCEFKEGSADTLCRWVAGWQWCEGGWQAGSGVKVGGRLAVV